MRACFMPLVLSLSKDEGALDDSSLANHALDASGPYGQKRHDQRYEGRQRGVGRTHRP